MLGDIWDPVMAGDGWGVGHKAAEGSILHPLAAAELRHSAGAEAVCTPACSAASSPGNSSAGSADGGKPGSLRVCSPRELCWRSPGLPLRQCHSRQGEDGAEGGVTAP